MTRFHLVLTALAAALLAPAAAQGATLTTDLPCYVEKQAMTVTGADWAAGSAFSLAGDSIAATGTADALGGWSADVTAPPTPGRSTRPRTVVLTGDQDGAPVATTTFRTIDFLVDPQGSSSGRPTSSRIVRFSGFQPGRRIYLHVKRRGAKRVYTRVVGRPKAPCGTFRRRLRRLPAIPASKIRFGRYTIAFDSRRRYSKRTLPQFVFNLTIVRQSA